MSPASPPSLAMRFLPCALAFIASFCIMVIELVAGRLIAKHVGASLYTWTSVIGVVLGGITIGNLVGGHIADRFQPRKALCVLYWLAALACFSLPHLDWLVGTEDVFGLSKIEDWGLRIALHVGSVFLLPSTILGLIGPVTAKLALDQGLATGRTVGNVYAWGALGSILGTFITGFYLIQLLGTKMTIFGVSGLLAVVGVLLAPLLSLPMMGILLCGGWWELHKGPFEIISAEGRTVIREKEQDEDIVYLDESQYSFIKIDEDRKEGHRDLVLDHLIHSHLVEGDIEDLRYDYEKIYASLTVRFAGEQKGLRTLFIGGGGYIFPRYIRSKWPASRVQVAEIDPGVTKAVLTAFGMKRDEVRILKPAEGLLEDLEKATGAPPSDTHPIEIHHLDARNHVDDLVARVRRGGFEGFDFVYGDAFNHYAVPFHLVTREFNARVREILKPRTGIYMINIIDIFYSSRFLGAVYNALREEFPFVYVYSTEVGGASEEPDRRDTFIVVAALAELDLKELGLRGSEPKFEGSLLNEEQIQTMKDRSGGVILSDDYSPVENLLEYVIRQNG